MNDPKMILLIGRSGKGKSTLANVITSTNKFKESEKSASETRKIQFERFKDRKNSFNYQIIDTPGIGDTKLEENEVLDIIAEAVYLVRGGVSQVFFVINGRFDKYEMATYDLLRTIIFDKDIAKHTTIVRTNFKNFKNEEKYRADIKSMIKEAQAKKTELEQDIATKEKELANLSSNNAKYQELLAELEKVKKELVTTNLAEIIESCQKKIIYVDNPSLKITVPDKEDEEDREDREEEIKSNENKRSESRKIILNHLQNICQSQEDYNPPNLKKLSAEIADDYSDYLKKKEELQKELDGLKASKVESSKNEFKNTSAFESNKTDLVVEKEESQTEEENNVGIIKTQELIAQLQSRKEKLKKEIAEKEKAIRQKVLKHIFNNYDGVSKELGGDIFLSSVVGNHDWPEINSQFINKELVVGWLSKGFDYQQTKNWATALSDFNPEIDADFCAWLRDNKQLTVEKIKRSSYPQNVERWRNEYTVYLGKETEILGKHAEQLEENSLDQQASKEFLEDYLFFIQTLVKELQDIITDLEQSNASQQSKQYYQEIKQKYESNIYQVKDCSEEKVKIFLKDYLSLMNEGVDNCDEAVNFQGSTKEEKQYYQKAKWECEAKIIQVQNYLEKWK